MKILVVEDSRAMRMILVRTLRQAGFGGHDVLESESAREALGMIETEEPDLILSDWNMPGMTGIDFLATLRSRGDATPFCFITSEGSDEIRERASAAGAFGLIAKPFTVEAFLDVLSPVVTS
jgi:two-component system, chemotaxis family, chemotaxis protein CheY